MKDAIEILKAEKPFLARNYGVEEIGLFGSAARGEETPYSDIDILVKRKIQTIDNYFSILDYLESKFNRKVDLVTNHPGLPPRFLNLIKKDIIYV